MTRQTSTRQPWLSLNSERAVGRCIPRRVLPVKDGPREYLPERRLSRLLLSKERARRRGPSPGLSFGSEFEVPLPQTSSSTVVSGGIRAGSS